MDRRLTITIPEHVAARLRELAAAERRDPRAQAALLLERALLARKSRRSRAHGHVPADGRVDD